MAAAPPKAGSSRLEVAGKLTALIGLPLLVIGSIFSAGLYVGATRSYRIVVLEARYLGFEAPPGAELGGGDDGVARPGDTDAGETEGTPAADTEGAPEQPEQPDKPTQPDKPAQPEQPDEPSQPETPTTSPAPTSGLPLAKAGPVGPELRSLFDQTRVVRVKLLVDPALVVAREDWLRYAVNLLEATRGSFEALFGVDVEVQAIAVWDVSAGADPDAMLDELAAHEREGADVILGLVARPQPSDFEPRAWTGDVHGDHALVFADLQQDDRYYRNLLRTLAGLLGAEPATDPASKQLGSFMSDAEPPSGTAPVIDPENRGRVIFRKQRPFAASAKPDKPKPKPKPEGDDAEEN